MPLLLGLREEELRPALPIGFIGQDFYWIMLFLHAIVGRSSTLWLVYSSG